MIFAKQKTEKDASVFSFEDTYLPSEGYSQTEKDPVLAPIYTEEVQEFVQDIAGVALVPPSVGKNTVFKASIYASISGGLLGVTVWKDLFANYSYFEFILQKGNNEIGIFDTYPVDQVDLKYEGLYTDVVGGWEDNFFIVRAGVSSGGLIV